MAKEIAAFIKLQVKGGAATPSPPIDPALGSNGVNIMQFCKQFNGRTQELAGKVVPVVITVYADNSFVLIIKPPPVAVQLIEAVLFSLLLPLKVRKNKKPTPVVNLLKCRIS